MEILQHDQPDLAPHSGSSITSVPNDKILDQSKLKAFADVKLNVNQNLKFELERVETNAGKGENAGYQHFLLYLQCF